MTRLTKMSVASKNKYLGVLQDVMFLEIFVDYFHKYLYALLTADGGFVHLVLLDLSFALVHGDVWVVLI